MNRTSHLRLLGALSGAGPDAAAAWRAWRDSLDIQHVTWPEMQVLPLLNGPRLEAWLADDPASGILLGIVRRAWSEAQVRLAVARELVTGLNAAGCDSVTVMGAMGAYLRSLRSTAIRPILELRLLIPRRQLGLAAAALQAQGWEGRDELPHGEWLDRTTHVFYSRNGTRLCLHWRVLQVDAPLAAATEREFLSHHRIVQAMGTSFRILAPGHALLETLAGSEESVDALPWQADAALICRPAICGETIDWARWARLANRYQPQVLERIPELRAMDLGIPAFRPRAALLARLSHFASWRRSAGGWARRFSAAAGKQ